MESQVDSVAAWGGELVDLGFRLVSGHIFLVRARADDGMKDPGS